MKKFTVIGNPIEHSLSPTIHALFAKQFSIELEYTKTLVLEESFNAAIEKLKQNSITGANVTVPLKELAFSQVDILTERAQLAGAVNTLHFVDNNLIGDNTDGVGLISDLVENININLENKNTLIIGAGGAARGIIAPLLDAKCNITICNRTMSKATNLAEKFKKHGSITAIPLNEVTKEYDLIINATSASLKKETININDSIIGESTICYDLMYSQKPTTFMEWATENNVKQVYDGLGMLVGQAAHSFKLWHGKAPNQLPVIRELR